MKRFIAFATLTCDCSARPLAGLNRRTTMVSLMIGVGVLFVAVMICAVFDPWPSPGEHADAADEGVPTIDAIVLAV
jgi:hypothetical protein